VFHVDDVLATGLVSLAEAKAHLNMSATVLTNDGEVRELIDAATNFIESKIGPVVRRTIVDTVTPGADGRLYLDGPVISVTTLTAAHGYTETYDVATTFLDGPAGVVIPPYAGTFSSPVTVTYIGGRVITPPLIRRAALDYIKWLWESQRGATPLPTPGGEFEVATSATVPWKITQALEPYMLGGVA
jgi:hypothetical protein